jgi:hypothetical protein
MRFIKFCDQEARFSKGTAYRATVLNAGGSPGSGSGITVKAPALPGAVDTDQAGAVPAPLQKHRGRYQLIDEKTGKPLAGAAYVLVQPDGRRLAGYSDGTDYIDIACTSDQFSVLEVTDCRDNGERERDREYNAQTKPTQAYDSRQWPVPLERPQKAPIPVPVYGPIATPKPAYVEAWTLAQEAVESLREGGKSALDALSQEVRQYLESASAWLTQQGKWVRQEAGKAWEWVSESTGEVLRWTDEQLREMWKQVQHYTDLTLDMLKEVDWVQVLVDIGIVVGTVVVVIAIGAGLVAAGVPAAIVSALVVLVRLAQMFWVVLATVLGGGAVLTAASA